MRPRSHVAPFIVQMGRQFAQVTQLGGGRAETQPGLPVLTPRSAVTCPSLWGICSYLPFFMEHLPGSGLGGG